MTSSVEYSLTELFLEDKSSFLSCEELCWDLPVENYFLGARITKDLCFQAFVLEVHSIMSKMEWRVLTFGRWKVIRTAPVLPVVRPQALMKALWLFCLCISTAPRETFPYVMCYWIKYIYIIVDPEVLKSHLLNQNRYSDLRNNWLLAATHTMQKILRRWKMSSSF